VKLTFQFVEKARAVVGNHRAAAQCQFVRNLLPVRAKPRPNFSKIAIIHEEFAVFGSLWKIPQLAYG